MKSGEPTGTEDDFEIGVPVIHASKRRLKEKIFFPEEVIDEIAQKVAVLVENSMPVRKIRRSQILTVVLGFLGFSFFTFGITKIFADTPGPVLFFAGLILMIIGGVSLQNTLKP